MFVYFVFIVFLLLLNENIYISKNSKLKVKYLNFIELIYLLFLYNINVYFLGIFFFDLKRIVYCLYFY